MKWKAEKRRTLWSFQEDSGTRTQKPFFEILKESFSHKKARKLTNEQKNDISNGGLQYQMIDPRKKAMGEATELL